MNSETERYRHLTRKYCYREDGWPGCGVDLGSGGDPVVPWAMSLDLPPEEFVAYGKQPWGAVQLRGRAEQLPFDELSLDFVYSSHLLEDYTLADRWTVMNHWMSRLRPGGHLIILVPEFYRWHYAVSQLGQPANPHHKCEPQLGELSDMALEIGMEVIEERLTLCHPRDYTLLFVGRRRWT